MSEEVSICKDHQEYKTPTIYTFAFNGAELWCPYCGQHSGSFDGQTNLVKATKTLLKRKEVYKKVTRSYIKSYVMINAESIMYKGTRTKTRDLPIRSQQYWSRIREKGWVNFRKAESFK